MPLRRPASNLIAGFSPLSQAGNVVTASVTSRLNTRVLRIVAQEQTDVQFATARPATGLAAAPTLLQPSPRRSTRGSSIRPFRRPFPGSSSTQSGSIAARAASMFATATASTMPNAVPTWIVECAPCVTASRCAGLAKGRRRWSSGAPRFCSEVRFQMYSKWRF
jgi:hypothetical protein